MTKLSVAVVTRRRCSLPAFCTAFRTLLTPSPVLATVHTTVAQFTCRSCALTSSLNSSSVMRVSFTSHLLTTTTTAAPSAAASSDNLKSCCVTPSLASTTMTVTSARRIARNARSTLIGSAPSLVSATRARLRMPAVSIRTNDCPLMVTSVSTASRVVPLMSHTMERSSPTIALSRLLLPTLGRPTMATLSGASSLGSSVSSERGGGKAAASASSISPVPDPEMADTGSGSSPSSQNSDAMRSACAWLSHLLATSTRRLLGCAFRSHCTISRSVD
mmetsp:Transcript_8771/g.26590  ORF Transcript_8771/g.26590 Transcript_8771/m.26590 type:complete len:275 (-) Transcript_8771:644-1468(-)